MHLAICGVHRPTALGEPGSTGLGGGSAGDDVFHPLDALQREATEGRGEAS